MRMAKKIHLVEFVKNGECYIFVYTKKTVPEILRILGKWAHNEDLNLSWYDAACISQKIRKEGK